MDDRELLRRFEDCSLPFELWRQHRTHVKVSYLMLRAHPFDVAVPRMRRFIQAINDANGVPDGPLMGYNETTTRAFLQLVHATMVAYGETHPTTDAESFVEMHPQLLSKHALRLFYSPARRIHPDAKASYVEPDMAPLPRHDRAAFGFAVLYRWRLHPGAEARFQECWETIVRAIAAGRGGLGSRLHRAGDGTWVAYARWPSREAWERSNDLGPVDPDAAARMAECVAERFDPLPLEPLRDLLA